MSKPEVSLTFVGDTVSLERANKRAQESVAATAKAFDKSADHAVAASQKMRHVAEASDEIDTLGSKATSSLGALSSGFELLGPSGEGAAKGLMTAALATDALSGAGEAATIATETLKGTLGKAKAAFQGFSTAGKTAVLSLGALGAAAAVAGVVFLALKARQDDIKESTAAYVDTLDKATHATTGATRAQIYKTVQDKEATRAAKEFNLSSRDLVDAVLGQQDAMDKVNRSIAEHKDAARGDKAEMIALGARANELNDFIARQQTALRDAQDALGDQEVALGKAAIATKSFSEAITEQNKLLRDQLDPQLNLYHRLQDVTAAQKEYTDAVKKHGTKSQEARDAIVKLAEAQLSVKDASAQAGSAIDAHGVPSIKDLAKQANLSSKQAQALADALKATGVNADKLNGKQIRFSVTQVNKVVGANSSASRAGFDLEGNPLHRASGGMTPAGVVKVGEAGPELLALGTPGYVANARDTMNILSGGARPAPVTRPVFEFRSSGGTMEDAVVTAFEKAYKQGRITVLAKAA